MQVETLDGFRMTLDRRRAPNLPRRGSALDRAAELLARDHSWLAPDERLRVDACAGGVIVYGEWSAVPRRGMFARAAGGRAAGFIVAVGEGLAILSGGGPTMQVPLVELLLPRRGCVGDAAVFGYDGRMVNAAGGVA